MDGFKLLEHVGLEMDLPVIMMSVDGETSRVMKGVQHGACDYLLKPIRMKELRNIWQHVFRKRIHEVKEIENHEGLEEIQFMRSIYDHPEDGNYPTGNDLISGKKRKDFENRHDDRDCNESSSVKKSRVVWTVDLHQKFVNAVNHIGFDKVGPKKILDLMGVPWLTRENVASHLQKYRLYLSRLQKEKEQAACFNGIKNSDVSMREHTGNQLQNSVNSQQSNCSSGISVNKTTAVQNIDFKTPEGDMKSTVTMQQMVEPKNAQNADNNLDSQKGSSSRMGVTHPFKQLESDVKYAAAATIPKQYTWDTEGLELETSQHFQPKSGFNPQPFPSLHQNIPFDCVKPNPPFESKPSNMNRDNMGKAEMKPVFVENDGNQGVEELSLEGNMTGLYSTQPENELGNSLALKPNNLNLLWSIKDHSSDQFPVSDVESAKRSHRMVSGSSLATWEDNPQDYSRESDFHHPVVNGGFENIESFNYSDPSLISEVPPYLYDSLKFDYELPLDSMEYPVIDQALFIV